MSEGDDPFGRRKDEETDAFGRPVERGGSLWSGGDAAPAGWLPPSEAAPPPSAPSPPAFRPPTDAAPDVSARSGGSQTPSTQPAGDQPAGGQSADYMQRVGAAAIDFVIRAVVLVVLVVALAGIGGEDAASVGVFVLLLLVLPFYGPVLMSRWDGQTVGHRATGTRIVTKHGAPVTGGKAVVREVVVKNLLIEMIGGLFSFGILGLLNYLWPLWDDRYEALHDKICDTRVVKA